MKNLTKNRLEKILRDAVAATGYDTEPSDVKNLFASIKIGLDASYHTGSKGTLGYFAIEGTVISAMNYMAPALFYKFEEVVNAGLAKIGSGLFAEPINSVEYGIYK